MIVGMWGESVNGVDLNKSLNSLEASQDLAICGWPLCTETYRAVEFGNYAPADTCVPESICVSIARTNGISVGPLLPWERLEGCERRFSDTL
jgi:hypothetical protein